MPSVGAFSFESVLQQCSKNEHQRFKSKHEFVLKPRKSNAVKIVSGIGFAEPYIMKFLSIVLVSVTFVILSYSAPSFSQGLTPRMYLEPKKMDGWKQKVEIREFKKEFEFKFDDEIYNTDVSLSYDDKKICDQKTKEWQKNFGTKVKDSAKSYDDVDLGIFSTEYPCQFVIEQLAKRLIDEAEDGGFSDEEKINLLIAFVNFIPYETEPSDQDYWRTPYETLRDGTGDCEDTSFLLAELISLAGFDSLLTQYKGHMSVCANPGEYVNTNKMNGWVISGKSYYFCEPTPNNGDESKCWKLGEYPTFVKDKGSPTSTRLVPAHVVANPVTSYQPKNEPRTR